MADCGLVKPLYRSSLQMYADGMTVPQIAETIGDGEGAVRSRIMRARARMRQLLAIEGWIV